MTTAYGQDCEPHWDLAIGQPGLTGSSALTSPRAMAMFDAGFGSHLHTGGIFTHAGGLFVNRIARWNGAVWWGLAGGANQTVWGLTTYDDGEGEALYATGFFTQIGGVAANKIAKWSGGFWTPLGDGLGDDYAGIALLGHDDGAGRALYIGGYFAEAGGQTVNGIAKWDFANQTYSPLGAGMAPPIHAQVNELLNFDDGSGAGEGLYASGWFTSAGGEPASRVARWDFNAQAWSAVGAGVPGPALAMALFDDGSGNGEQLYVGGSFADDGDGTANYLARWNADTQDWEPVATVLNAASRCCPNGVIHTIAVFDDGSGPALYVGGAFTSIGDLEAYNFARWDGTPGGWSAVTDQVIEGGSVTVLHATEDDLGTVLYVGGRFNSISGQTASKIAAYRGCPSDPSCEPPDLNCDGVVGVQDLLILLSQWGPCPDCNQCPADLDGDCAVGVNDLLILLSNWG